MIICVTGTPGAGKTTLSKELALKLNYVYLDANTIIKKYDLEDGFDKKMDSYIVDVEKLESAVLKEIITIKSDTEQTNFIIDSHMSHHFSNKNINLCIVCTCELKELKKRLESRHYKETKIKDNLDVEIFETCFIEAQENNHNILKSDNNTKINDLMKYIEKNTN